MYLNAGDLDQFVTLQKRATGLDSLGNANGAWENVSGLTDIRAKVDTRPGQDFFAGGQDQATAPATFRIRWSETRWSTITPAMRLTWRGQVFEIVGQPINVKGADVAIDLQCIAGAKDGR